MNEINEAIDYLLKKGWEWVELFDNFKVLRPPQGWDTKQISQCDIDEFITNKEGGNDEA